MQEAAARHPEAERVELWFMDEARIGQKGRVTHVWYQKGTRPRGLHEHRFASAHLFGAVCPARDTGVALVLPEVSTAAMNLFLAELAAAVPARTHAVLVLDRAGWHVSENLSVPANLTLVHLPPYSPELVWGFACQGLTIAAPPSSAVCSRLMTGDDDRRGACLGARGVAPQPAPKMALR